mgnify:CR=1 FL=1
MINYVVIFCFSNDKKNVLLVQKNRPEWQKGKLNGIGGKIEDRENPESSVIREFKEETGVDIIHPILFVVINSPDLERMIYFFYIIDDNAMQNYQTITDEKIIKIPTKYLYKFNILYNLNWLIPLALDPNVKSFMNVISL